MREEVIEATDLKANASPEAIESALARDLKRTLDYAPWEAFPIKYRTNWSLLHGPDAFFLSFEVHEPTVRAVALSPEDPVCEDSCVEWFFDWGKNLYINVEINPIGTSTVEKGMGRHGRENLMLSGAPGFRSWGSMGEEPFEEKAHQGSWRAWAVIPYDLAPVRRSELLENGVKANFYKCGDKLTQPHYNTWGPMSSLEPDYHRPEDFIPLSFKA